MSEMWNRTLVYLGLREEPEELYEETPARFDPQDDPHAEHAPERPRGSRALVGAAATGPRAENGRPEPRGSTRNDTDEDRRRSGSSRSEREAVGDAARERTSTDDSNVRSLRSGDPHVRGVEHGSTRAARVALVEVAAFDDVESIGSRFRTGQPVLFDIRPGDTADARRVVDFVSGLTYASRGRLTKVGSRAFLLVPDGVELSDDEQRRLRGLGYRLPVAGDA
jgi:cell division inhibitor SepF